MKLQQHFSLCMRPTQGIPVESLASKMHLFSDRYDLLSQHNELCFAQAVHYRVVAVDEVVQITNIPKRNVETGEARDGTNQWFCVLCIQLLVSIIT